MSIGRDEYDDLIEGYEGLSGPLVEDVEPAPLTDEEFQQLQETVAQGSDLADSPLVTAPLDLQLLRPDEPAAPGVHYVISGGRPMPVLRIHAGTEDAYVREQISTEGLRDHDGHRAARAERSLRVRFRGYLAGEITSL